MAEEKLAEPNRTHQFKGIGSAAINTDSEQPSSDLDRDRKLEDKVELIGIKKPGEHILDAILNAASSSSLANKEYKVYAPRRIFPDKTKLTGAFDQNYQETAEKKVQRALSSINAKSNNQVDGASSSVDAAEIKRQVADSLGGVYITGYTGAIIYDRNFNRMGGYKDIFVMKYGFEKDKSK